jgi:hypothetical protein
MKSRVSSVEARPGYGLDDEGAWLDYRQKQICSRLNRQGWLWGPPCLLFNGYLGLFLRDAKRSEVRLTTHLPSRSTELENLGELTSTSTCWYCGFKSRRGLGCLSLVSVVSYRVEVSAPGWSLVQRSLTESWVSESDNEASTMRNDKKNLHLHSSTCRHGVLPN